MCYQPTLIVMNELWWMIRWFTQLRTPHLQYCNLAAVSFTVIYLASVNKQKNPHGLILPPFSITQFPKCWREINRRHVAVLGRQSFTITFICDFIRKRLNLWLCSSWMPSGRGYQEWFSLCFLSSIQSGVCAADSVVNVLAFHLYVTRCQCTAPALETLCGP